MDSSNSRRPRVLVLRPEGQSPALAALLTRFEMEAVVVPVIRIIPGDSAAIDHLLLDRDRFDWVAFTSANGVRAVAERSKRADLSLEGAFRRVAAIGPGTKKELEAEGVSVEWTPSSYTTKALGAELPYVEANIGGKPKVAVIRADIAGTQMDETLEGRGFDVTRINAYRTEDIAGERLIEELSAGIDAIAFTSASIVNAFVRGAGADSPASYGAAVCSIGPATSEALRSAGLHIEVEAKIHSTEGLAEEIATHLGSGGSGG